MTTKIKTDCWFENNNKIVPKLNKQYILKKDLKMAKKWSQCNYPSGMVVKVVEYIPILKS